MITADMLDQMIDHLQDQNTDLVRFYEELGNDMPVLTHLLIDSDTQLLTDAEHDYLLFLGMVLIRVFQADHLLGEDLNPDSVAEKEEQLWQMTNDLSPRPLEKLWERTPPDAILTDFLLEALTADDDAEFLTETGAQIMYVKLAVLTDLVTP